MANAHRTALAIILTLTSACGEWPGPWPLPASGSQLLSSDELVGLCMPRWTEATGLTARDIGPVWAYVTHEDIDCGGTGLIYRGCTYYSPDEVVIALRADLGSEVTRSVMCHELGHALGIVGRHLSTGVMQTPSSPDYKIDAHTVEEVCANQPCTRFNPEN